MLRPGQCFEAATQRWWLHAIAPAQSLMNSHNLGFLSFKGMSTALSTAAAADTALQRWLTMARRVRRGRCSGILGSLWDSGSESTSSCCIPPADTPGEHGRCAYWLLILSGTCAPSDCTYITDHIPPR